MLYKNNRGFTLIELLVVIAIIGILSSVVLASLNTAREKSRDASRISDIRQIQLALELFFDAQTPARYPTNAEGLAILVTDGFLPTLPTPPAGVAGITAYDYDQVSDVDYCLGAIVEDSSAIANNNLDADCDADPGGAQSASYLAGGANDVHYSVEP